MHFKEINIKNKVYKYYFDYLIKAKRIRGKKKTITIWPFISLDMIVRNQ